MKCDVDDDDDVDNDDVEKMRRIGAMERSRIPSV